MRVAVIGAGIAGLAAAYELNKFYRVTLFEAETSAGGHANTVDITLDGIDYPVDTGFLVLNERTYPRLIELFAKLEIELAPSEMSFSASMAPNGVEWSGSSLRTLFAQPTNLLSPRFLGMVRDIVRFNRQANELAASADSTARDCDEALGTWLDRNNYGPGFRDWYLLPMAAAIWSCPMQTMKSFPVGSFVRFFHNHGLLQIENRPQWFTVKGGSRHYVDKIVDGLSDVRLSCPVTRVSRGNLAVTGQIEVSTAQGTEPFDAVVMACHSPQALALLADPDSAETALLGSISYQKNAAFLHTDRTLMPRRRSVWAAWNYFAQAACPESDATVNGEPRVALTYWLNRLQPLPFESPVFLTLNPATPPRVDRIIRQIGYEHPVLDRAAIAAQSRAQELQGRRNTWFAGAWLGYGFHEDGLVAGQAVARQLLALQADLTRLARAA